MARKKRNKKLKVSNTRSTRKLTPKGDVGNIVAYVFFEDEVKLFTQMIELMTQYADFMGTDAKKTLLAAIKALEPVIEPQHVMYMKASQFSRFIPIGANLRNDLKNHNGFILIVIKDKNFK